MRELHPWSRAGVRGGSTRLVATDGLGYDPPAQSGQPAGIGAGGVFPWLRRGGSFQGRKEDNRVGATVKQLAAMVRGRLIGDGELAIDSARPVAEAGPRDITFVDDDRYAKMLRASPAAAAIVGPHFKLPAIDRSIAVIEVADPRRAFVEINDYLRGEAGPRWTGIDPRASVAATAKIGPGAAIHAFAAIGEDVEIGADATILPGVVIRERCRIGAGVMLHPNVVLYPGVILGDRVEVHAGSILGGDGFGYRLVDGRHVKQPQTGWVEIGDDVEIGANCTIDRGTFDATKVGAGTKIDNLVMIGHNNRIGRHNLLCGQVGMAGSCNTGDYVFMAGQAGIKDHVQIGDRSIVGAQAGVHNHIPPGQQVLGSPAIPVKEQRRIFAMIAKLPEMHKQLRELSTQVALLSAALPDMDSAAE